MRADWDEKRVVTEADRVVIVRDLSLAISSAFTVETEMITTFTDSERHRQDSNAQMLSDNLGKPQGALTNPKGDQEPKLSLVDTEPGRRCMKNAVTPASPSTRVKEGSRDTSKTRLPAAYATKY